MVLPQKRRACQHGGWPHLIQLSGQLFKFVCQQLQLRLRLLQGAAAGWLGGPLLRLQASQSSGSMGAVSASGGRRGEELHMPSAC